MHATEVNPFGLSVGCRLASRGVCNHCRHIDWQVSAAAQVSDALVPALSVVERLYFGYGEQDIIGATQ